MAGGDGVLVSSMMGRTLIRRYWHFVTVSVFKQPARARSNMNLSLDLNPCISYISESQARDTVMQFANQIWVLERE